MSTSGVCMYGHAETVCSGCGTVFPAGVASAGAVCFCGRPLEGSVDQDVEGWFVRCWAPLCVAENPTSWERTAERLFGMAAAFRAVGLDEWCESAVLLQQVAEHRQWSAWYSFSADLDFAEGSWLPLRWSLPSAIGWRRLCDRLLALRKGGFSNQQVIG